MRLLIVACAAISFSAATAEPLATATDPLRPIGLAQINSGKHCPKPLFERGSTASRPEVKKLNQLPPAAAFHAVYRVDANGCLDPVMVGYQYKRGR